MKKKVKNTSLEYYQQKYGKKDSDKLYIALMKINKTYGKALQELANL